MTELVRYDAACRAIAEAKSVDEAKDIRDRAEAMRLYARQAGNRALEVDAAEIRLRAERRLGELIKAQKDTVGLNTGARGIGTSAVPKENRTPTLADVGIDKKLSSRAQKLAAMPPEKFDATIIDFRERAEKTSGRILLPLDHEHQLRREASRETRLQEMAELAANPLALPEGQFGAGIIDPPWEDPDNPIGFNERHYRHHYPTMSPAEIAALKPGGRLLADVFAPRAFLALWATRHIVAIGAHVQVLEAYRFAPNTLGVWDKELIGLGNGFLRDDCELLVFATRGNVPVPTRDRPRALFRERRTSEHSQKTQIPHDWIEAWFPDVPKIELFARTGRKGWAFWGHEARTPPAAKVAP